MKEAPGSKERKEGRKEAKTKKGKGKRGKEK